MLYRRYLARPAVVSSLLFQLSLVSCGSPFLNTDILSSVKSSCAYFSRLACSACSTAFLEVRVVDLVDLRRKNFPFAGAPILEGLALGEPLGAGVLVAITAGRTPAASIVFILRGCFDGDRCLGVMTGIGFLADFGSSLVISITQFRISRSETRTWAYKTTIAPSSSCDTYEGNLSCDAFSQLVGVGLGRAGATSSSEELVSSITSSVRGLFAGDFLTGLCG